MLQSLTIKNYVLIEALELQFGEGLSIITGETGAGKSILVGALSLILGERADTGVLQNKQEKCVVEGSFSLNGSGLEGLFQKHDLDFEPVTLLRREINAAGKSRAFVNDTPVKIAALKEIGSELVDIHSQHEKLLLYNPGFHLSVVDAFAQHEPDIEAYRREFAVWQQEQKLLEEMVEKEKTALADCDYMQFQLNELTTVELESQNIEALEEESARLSHAEEIKQALQSAAAVLNGEEGGALPAMASAMTVVSRIAGYLKSAAELEQRLKSVSVELNDIAYELERIDEATEYDPQRLEQVTELLNTMNRLLLKHGADSIETLIALKDKLASGLSDTKSLESAIAEKRKTVDLLHASLTGRAMKLSKARKAVFKSIEEEIGALVERMGMRDAAIRIGCSQLKGIGPSGVDEVEILLRSNKGGEFAALNEAASGGELSRVMLAIKSCITRIRANPTMIFDEIDSGVSGEIADKMGSLMKDMAAARQVIAVTHLPQIAGKADTHFLAFKVSDGKMAHSGIRKLSGDERVDEIAKMLSGVKMSDAALANARELLRTPGKTGT